MKRIFLLLLLMITTVGAQDDLSGLFFCIDPGHHNYPNDKPFETRINLRVSTYFREYLEGYGAEVIETHTDSSVYLSLSQREYIANSNNVDFFLSIHHNAYNGTRNTSLMLYEELSNRQPEWPGEADRMSNIMVKYLHNYLYTTGERVSGDFSFYGSPSYLGVLNQLMMPGVLSEASFWDYIPEVHRLNAKRYLKLEAFAMLHSYLDYFGVSKKPQTYVEGVLEDHFSQKLPGVQVRLTNGTDDMVFVTDSENIGITYQDNQWGGFPYIEEVRNGMFFFPDFPAGPAKLIIDGENVISDSVDIIVKTAAPTTVATITVVSTKPPQVTLISPVEKERLNVKVTSPLIMDFSKAMNPDSLTAALNLDPAHDYNLYFRNNNTQMRIYPVGRWDYWTEYTLTISGETAEDAWGYHLDGNKNGEPGDDFQVKFRTRPQDMTGPELVATFPKNGTDGVSTAATVMLEFDEPLDSASISRQTVMLTKSGIPVQSDIRYEEQNQKGYILIEPKSPLLVNRNYIVKVSKAVTDSYNNRLPNIISFSFSTSGDEAPVTIIENFEDGVNNWLTPSGSGSTAGIVKNNTTFSAVSEPTLTQLNSTGVAKLTYQWDLNASKHLLREYLMTGAPRDVYFDTNTILQAFLYGDGSSNLFRFCIDELDNGQHEVSDWIPIDWVGWRQVEWDLTSGSTNGTWIGDGHFTGSLRFDSFQLKYAGVPEMDGGVLYFDNLQLAAVSTSGIADDLTPAAPPLEFALSQNYPNPFNGNTIIPYQLDAEAADVTVAVFNVLGQRIRLYS
ncbi:Ig-like domain-containing protein, partial [bacterium]|nr:Ig-like domain-containing protein [bacterium]